MTIESIYYIHTTLVCCLKCVVCRILGGRKLKKEFLQPLENASQTPPGGPFPQGGRYTSVGANACIQAFASRAPPCKSSLKASLGLMALPTHVYKRLRRRVHTSVGANACIQAFALAREYKRLRKRVHSSVLLQHMQDTLHVLQTRESPILGGTPRNERFWGAPLKMTIFGGCPSKWSFRGAPPKYGHFEGCPPETFISRCTPKHNLVSVIVDPYQEALDRQGGLQGARHQSSTVILRGFLRSRWARAGTRWHALARAGTRGIQGNSTEFPPPRGTPGLFFFNFLPPSIRQTTHLRQHTSVVCI